MLVLAEQWTQTGEASFELLQNGLRVQYEEPEAGMEMTIDEIDAACTYEYCITITEMEPEPVLVQIFDEGGEIIVDATIEEAGQVICWTIEELDGIESLTILVTSLEEAGHFVVSHTSLSSSCPDDILIADVLSSQDYYPGGSVLPGRSFTSESYRYGFNGMEKDDEVKGNNNSLDYGARIYDPRLMRWLSVDPLANKYPANSPYSFAANSPIAFIDPNGKENTIYLVILSDASAKLTVEQKEEIVRKANEILHEKLGVDTEVKLYEGSDPFDPNNIDNTDSYMVLGKKEELITADQSAPLYTGSANKKELNATNAAKLNGKHPEISDRAYTDNGQPKLNPGGIIQLEGATEFAGELKGSITDVIALIVVHGGLHNAYTGDHVQGTVLASGDELRNGINNGKTLSDYEKDTESGTLKSAMEATYGKSEPEDNYEENKSNR